MRSLKELYRIGVGPSASHTLGPKRAAQRFLQKNDKAAAFRVTLFGSLAATGKGHLTDSAIEKAFAPKTISVVWKPKETLPEHPNGMLWEAVNAQEEVKDSWTVYSVGGGALSDDGQGRDVYPVRTMDALLSWAEKTGEPLFRMVEASEGEEIWQYLAEIWLVMKNAVNRGIVAEGVLPGALKLPRKARSYFQKAKAKAEALRRTGLLSAYALAVSEENAAAGVVATAPTCGACGVLPGVLKYLQETNGFSDEEILRALATGGLIGNLAKTNASISGAEVGCQGEVGVACAMAAGASCQLLGGSSRQIEYAAEMGLEHHLGLTCDPVGGLVQIPCIERNAVGASRALDCADYALLSDGTHRISFDEVVQTMKQTGEDLKSSYRETARGGLAVVGDRAALNDCG